MKRDPDEQGPELPGKQEPEPELPRKPRREPEVPARGPHRGREGPVPVPHEPSSVPEIPAEGPNLPTPENPAGRDVPEPPDVLRTLSCRRLRSAPRERAQWDQGAPKPRRSAARRPRPLGTARPLRRGRDASV